MRFVRMPRGLPGWSRTERRRRGWFHIGTEQFYLSIPRRIDGSRAGRAFAFRIGRFGWGITTSRRNDGRA